MTKKPHIAGSDNNRAVGDKIKQMFSSMGLPETWTESYPVELSYPVKRNVSVTANGSTYYAVMVEPTVNDGTQFGEEVIPTYHGYAPSGDVTGDLVYVNYGTSADYEYLDAMDVSLNGRIVIARYGHGFRGDKCMLAQQRGAIGCLIYSDPIDDGYLRGKTYPEGPWRPVDGVQRGSVWSGSGDPSTPGWPSGTLNPRLNVSELNNAHNPLISFPVLSIPTQPISASDAKPFLSALAGLRAPANMSGSTEWLTGGYFIGPGPAKVTMKIETDWSVKSIYNHFGRIVGSVEPDRYIIIGCHHDAWTYGGADPISGTVAMLEVVKAFGSMYRAGWRPRRTIIFASWDAEEYATVGSTEFVETHYKNLGNRLVAYLNLDIAVSGKDSFLVAGTPQWDSLLKNITKMVDMPSSVTWSGKTQSVKDYWLKTANVNGEPVVAPLGSGSDYSPFLQHAGISSLSIEFIGLKMSGGSYPQYHSRYDTYYFMNKFADPTWQFHIGVSKVLGLVAKALADSFILPFDFSNYHLLLQNGLNAIQLELKLRGISEGLNWDSTNEALALLKSAAAKTRETAWKMNAMKNPDPIAMRALNDRLFLAERGFLNYQGLAGQPWLRHMIYAPSKSDSYTASMFPTIVNAAAGPNPDLLEIQRQIQFVSIFIKSAAEVLGGGYNGL